MHQTIFSPAWLNFQSSSRSLVSKKPPEEALFSPFNYCSGQFNETLVSWQTGLKTGNFSINVAQIGPGKGDRIKSSTRGNMTMHSLEFLPKAELVKASHPLD